RSDGDLDAPPRDARAIFGFGPRLVWRSDEGGRGELRLYSPDLGPPQDVLVPSQWLAGERMHERRALTEDRVLLADLTAAGGRDVEEDLHSSARHDDARAGREGLDELVGHERERRADAIRDAGRRGHRGHRRREQDHREDADSGAGPPHQKVTEGRCTP